MKQCAWCEKQKKADNCIKCGRKAEKAREELEKSLTLIQGSDMSGRISAKVEEVIRILS